uniref:Uncharacterized protein n=1 Tax=Anguilla anguilla TaxID=7936 RepID=A0A0E9SMQ0_ANGAN
MRGWWSGGGVPPRSCGRSVCALAATALEERTASY